MKSVGQDPWESYCHLRNVQDLSSDGETPCERRCVELFSGPIIPFGAKVESHLISTEERARLQFGKKVLSGFFFIWNSALDAGGRWRGDILVAHVLREGDNFIFPCADGLVKVGQEKDLKSDHPIEFGETSKKEKNTAVIFKEPDSAVQQREQGRIGSKAWFMGGFTQFALLNNTPLQGNTWSGERLTMVQATSWARTHGQKFGQVCQRNLSKKKNSIGQKRSPKLDNARKLRGIYYVDRGSQGIQ